MLPYYLLIPLLHSHLVAILVEGNGGMSVPYEWKSVDFTWPSSRARDQAIQSGRYDPTKIAILDVDVYDPSNYGNQQNGGQRIFVTTPKFQPGVPVTFSTVSSKRAQDGSPLLEPFPNWSSQNEKDCDGLTSVYRVQIDECGRLWVLDTGKLDTFTASPRKLCSPQIVVYDLNRGDKVIFRHRFPESQLEENSLLITIAVDTRNAQCSGQKAYIADVNGYKMLVYDAATRESWPVTSNYFYPFPTYGAFDLNGAQFDLMDGIFGIALGPIQNNNRRVYFHSLASVRECWTFSSVLLNQSNFENNNTPTQLFKISDGERSSQSSSEVMNEEGILFFPLLKSNSLACWNSKTTFRQDNFVTLFKNDQTFQFVSGMKLISNRDLYVLTSRLQNYIATGVSDTSQVNYRILTARISDLTRKTACDVASSTNVSPDHWGYQVIENLIEEEIQQKKNTSKKPSKPSKHPKNPKYPKQYHLEDSVEFSGGESRGQQSQEKPLRMYYNDVSGERHSKSIENYIDAHLANTEELDDTHELYVKRRNSMEDEAAKEFQTGVKESKANKKAEGKHKAIVGHKPVRFKDKIPAQNSTRQSQNRQSKLNRDKYTQATFTSKPVVESEQTPIRVDDFVASEVDSFENDLNNMNVAISELDVPKYERIEHSGSLPDTEIPSRERSMSFIPSSGNSMSSHFGNSERGFVPMEGHLPRPHPSHNTLPHSNDQYSFDMQSNFDPSHPVVFKTNIVQNHAQPMTNYAKAGYKSGKERMLNRLYPTKGDCKPGYGKVYNHMLCTKSGGMTSSAPMAISYQQQEFFRGVN